jgi:hypothetical protein
MLWVFIGEYGQKGKDYSPSIPSGTRKIGEGTRDWYAQGIGMLRPFGLHLM